MFRLLIQSLVAAGFFFAGTFLELTEVMAEPPVSSTDPHAHFPGGAEIAAVTGQVHAGFRERGDRMIERSVLEGMPSFPPGEPWDAVARVQADLIAATGGRVRGEYRRQPPGLGAMNQVLGVLWLPQFEEQRPLANEMIVAMAEHWMADPHDLTEPPVYWGLGPLLRIYFLFHEGSDFHPGRLTPEAEEDIRALLWNFCAGRSGLEYATPERIRTVHDSENHDVMHKTTYYLASILFADHPDYARRAYYDGSTPAEQRTAWEGYFREWIRSRASAGLWIERNSATYAQFTLNGLLNLFDFTGNEDLRRRTGMLLDLSLVDWAQEQIAGVRGGAASRTPIPGTGRGHPMWGLAWVFFGQSGELAYNPPQQMFGVTTRYRPPAQAVALVHFPPAAPFEIANRSPGEGTSPHFDLVELARERFGQAGEPRHRRRNIPIYSLRPDSRILNYSYRTPEYVLGMAMIDPNLEYTLIHAQAKWAGAVMPAAGNPDTRIGPAPAGTGGSHLHFHSYWGVQEKSAMIFQKSPLASRIESMRVFISPHLEPVEEDGWLFMKERAAYAAVRVVTGGYSWEEEERGFLVLDEADAPVILQMGSLEEFGDFESFRQAVREAELHFDGERLDYIGPGAESLSFFATPGPDGRYRLPHIDGREIRLSPKRTFDSPFLQSKPGQDERIETRTGPIRSLYDFAAGEAFPP